MVLGCVTPNEPDENGFGIGPAINLTGSVASIFSFLFGFGLGSSGVVIELGVIAGLTLMGIAGMGVLVTIFYLSTKDMQHARENRRF